VIVVFAPCHDEQTRCSHWVAHRSCERLAAERAAEDYPCEYLDGLPDCETRMGVGTLFTAGTSASNKLCPIDGGRRYMTKGQKNLPDTFACVAQIGSSGEGKLGEALTAAMQKSINGPGGCNDGFLRDDALLMATFIGANPDAGGGGIDSDGYAEDWAKAVLDAKHGDPNSVVMLRFANPDWEPYDEIWKMAKMFPFMKVDRADVGLGDRRRAAERMHRRARCLGARGRSSTCRVRRTSATRRCWCVGTSRSSSSTARSGRGRCRRS